MKRTFYNIISAVLSRLVTVLGPFIVKTLIIYKLGNEYVGLNSLFTSLLSVLSLAELGIGSVLTFSMYAPVKSNDNNKLCALLKFYRKIYKYIGLIIIGAAIVITPLIPKLIKGSYPADINIYILFWIYIANTASSYMLFGYRSSVLIAYQHNNDVYNAQIATSLLMYVCQSVTLILGKNYYAYIIFLPITTIINNIVVYCVANKKYPRVQPVGELAQNEKYEIFGQIKNLSIHRIAGTIILSTDSIVISAMLGLNQLAIYSNYNYIFTAINGFFDVALVSITSTIGNKLLNSTGEEKYQLFKKVSFYSNILVAFCAVCMFNGYQTFIELWVGKRNMLTEFQMCWFCIYFFTYKYRSILMTFRDAAGLWEQDVWKSIIGMFSNIILDILFVKWFGVIGVLAATALIMFGLFHPWETYVLFKYMFKRKSDEYWARSLAITIATICASGIAYIILHKISFPNLVIEFVADILISVVIFAAVFSPIFIRNKDLALAFVNKIRKK